MKRKTFYNISLALPYLALVVSGGLAFFAYEAGMDWTTLDGLLGILAGSVIVFLVSSVIWGPLYTWMVVVMLFWGRGKPADEIRRMYLLSPILLGCSMGIPILFTDLPGSTALLAWGFLHLAHLDFIVQTFFKDYPLEESLGVGVAWVLMAAICLIVGYVFVGIVLLIEKSLKRRNLFKEELEKK